MMRQQQTNLREKQRAKMFIDKLRETENDDREEMLLLSKP